MLESPLPRRLAALLLSLMALASCSRSSSESGSSSPVDCREDLDCFIARASACLPTAVVHHERHTPQGLTIRITTRHELIGRVQGRCHLRRTQLSLDVQAAPTGGSEQSDNLQPSEELVQQALANLGPRGQSLMQCLYTETQTAEVMRRLQQGLAAPSDLEPCYPGDGSCGEVPLLAPGCVLGECLLGRWTFTCEANRGRDIYRCEGSRLSDVGRGCWSRCNKEGREEVECRPPRLKGHQEGSNAPSAPTH
jgi:hypothetical protein